MAGPGQHPDVGSGAEFPVPARADHDAAHPGILETQSLHRVVQFDVDAQIVGVELEFVAVEQTPGLVDCEHQLGGRTLGREGPASVARRAGFEVDAHAMRPVPGFEAFPTWRVGRSDNDARPANRRVPRPRIAQGHGRRSGAVMLQRRRLGPRRAASSPAVTFRMGTASPGPATGAIPAPSVGSTARAETKTASRQGSSAMAVPAGRVWRSFRVGGRRRAISLPYVDALRRFGTLGQNGQGVVVDK